MSALQSVLHPTLRPLSLALSSLLQQFNPRSLFASNEQGVWYDPSDFERYMEPGGPELSDAVALTLSATRYGTTMPLVAGKPYIITAVVEKTSGTSIDVGVTGASFGWQPGSVTVVTANGITKISRTYYAAADAVAQPTVIFTAAVGTVISFSVRELTSLSTASLYQDSAGTTPVTAVEQPVGLMLDKRLGLVRGVELVTNGTFDADTSGWTADAVGAALSWSAGRLVVGSDAAGFKAARQAVATTAGKTYQVTAVKSGGTAVAGKLRVYDGSSEILRVSYSSADSTSLRGLFTATSASTLIQLFTDTASATSEWDNISVREIPGNHASQKTTPARPTLKQDANGRYYLHFDGVDDFLSTGSIDFTSTDKMTVWAGVRKLSDSFGVVAELGADTATANGSLGLNLGAGVWVFRLRGSALTRYDASTYTAPVSNVLSCLYDIAGAGRATEIFPRVNGATPTLVPLNNVEAGTGNFASAALYIGRQGGASFPANIHLYGLTIRGAASTAAQIASAERFLANKTGVTLP